MKRRSIKSDSFSLEQYKNLLLKAKKLGYKFPNLSEYPKWLDRYPKFLLLRHDIDSSPLNALKMAKLEYALGLSANYYVMMHSPFYNVASSPYFDAMREMADMGHEIGLHYDYKFYEEKKMNPQKGLLRDIKALESVLDIKVRSVSQHKVATHSRINIGQSYVDAYDKRLAERAVYISDSGFKWRKESLTELIGKCPKIYALIHPATWAYSGLGMVKTYKKCSKIAEDIVDSEFSEFIEATKEYLRRRMSQEIK